MRVLPLALLALVFALDLPGQTVRDKAPAPPKASAQFAEIDINSATEVQLRSVPGIGEAYAKRIIAGRPYRAKNELVQKKILPAGVYEKARHHLIARQK